MVNTGCWLKVCIIFISHREEEWMAAGEVLFSTTCAFGVFCLSLLQDKKETEQLKSLERSFY